MGMKNNAAPPAPGIPNPNTSQQFNNQQFGDSPFKPMPMNNRPMMGTMGNFGPYSNRMGTYGQAMMRGQPQMDVPKPPVDPALAAALKSLYDANNVAADQRFIRPWKQLEARDARQAMMQAILAGNFTGLLPTKAGGVTIAPPAPPPAAPPLTQPNTQAIPPVGASSTADPVANARVANMQEQQFMELMAKLLGQLAPQQSFIKRADG